MKNQSIIAAAIVAALTVSNHAEITPQPLEATSLASFLDLYAKSFDLSASGTQSSFSYRMIVYLDGKPVGQTTWNSNATESGRSIHQRFTIIMKNAKEGIDFWIEHNSNASRRSIELETKIRPDCFPSVPVKNMDGSITLATKDKDNVLRDSDWAPSTGHMVVVLETKEKSEPAGAGQPATKPADKVPSKVQPSPPTSKDDPR